MGTRKELFDKGTDGRCHKWRHYFEIDERYFNKFVNNFATNDIFGVHFYDSVVVIEKRRINEPLCERK